LNIEPITSRPGRSTAARIGSAFISLIEPEIGFEREFNRWYADDHFYGGAMCLPWFFAGRRWVATKRLKDLRYPRESAFAKSNALGCYLHTYWIEDDHLDDMAPVLGKALSELTDAGRMFVEGRNFRRSHVYSAFQPYAGVTYREADEGAPRDIHALDYPYRGLVMEVIDTLEKKKTAPSCWVGWEVNTFRRRFETRRLRCASPSCMHPRRRQLHPGSPRHPRVPARSRQISSAA